MQWCGTCSLPQSQHELQLLHWLASGHRVWSDQWNKATTECTGKSDVFLACLAASKAKVSLSRAYWKQLGRNLFHRDFTLENMFETVSILHLIGIRLLLLNLVSVCSFLWNFVVCPGWFVALFIMTSHDMQDKVCILKSDQIFFVVTSSRQTST